MKRKRGEVKIYTDNWDRLIREDNVRGLAKLDKVPDWSLERAVSARAWDCTEYLLPIFEGTGKIENAIANCMDRSDGWGISKLCMFPKLIDVTKFPYSYGRWFLIDNMLDKWELSNDAIRILCKVTRGIDAHTMFRLMCQAGDTKGITDYAEYYNKKKRLRDILVHWQDPKTIYEILALPATKKWNISAEAIFLEIESAQEVTNSGIETRELEIQLIFIESYRVKAENYKGYIINKLDSLTSRESIECLRRARHFLKGTPTKSGIMFNISGNYNHHWKCKDFREIRKFMSREIAMTYLLVHLAEQEYLANPKNDHFFNILTKLPTEIQYTICNYKCGIPGFLIEGEEIVDAWKQLMRFEKYLKNIYVEEK